jgi:hypothetical protein
MGMRDTCSSILEENADSGFKVYEKEIPKNTAHKPETLSWK